jgi:integrase
MAHALPMILPQPADKRRHRKPSGQKAPLQPKEVWAIRVRLQLAQRVRDLALFNLAIDSKLRGCDLVGLKVADVAQMGEARARASVIQKKTGAPVRFEITPAARETINTWIRKAGLPSPTIAKRFSAMTQSSHSFHPSCGIVT